LKNGGSDKEKDDPDAEQRGIGSFHPWNVSRALMMQPTSTHFTRSLTHEKLLEDGV
jgi:hypothetical protein